MLRGATRRNNRNQNGSNQAAMNRPSDSRRLGLQVGEAVEQERLNSKPALCYTLDLIAVSDSTATLSLQSGRPHNPKSNSPA
ncbi:hypothetical protein E2C01_094656 [Portunus trituberculatus]|uniref:Uncharacterized protein n=1 Tax=Portunus trituberculatus TaxID=210409 RepID=A0A5B7K3R7_PORTR|nr:hypothetical protein [Portunus trituberculatus]